MNVLVDYHHKALLVSLYKLFVNRLGWNLYIPMGRDWFEREYWRIEDGPKEKTASDLVSLFLDTPTFPPFHQKQPETPKLKYAFLKDVEDGLKFDIIVSSVPLRYPTFEKLDKDFDMKAKLIFQAGNNFHHSSSHIAKVKNLLSSAMGPYTYHHAPNKVFYRQEFDIDLFCPEKPVSTKWVTNFQHYISNPELFYGTEKLMSDWKFRAFGAGCRELILSGVCLVAAWMRQSAFVFHVKQFDEGYGHTIHNAFACGKPLIIDTRYMWVYHKNEVPNTCMSLFTPDTIIDVKDNATPEKLAEELKRWEADYEFHSAAVYKRFKEVVDFDTEFIEIKKFLERLILI